MSYQLPPETKTSKLESLPEDARKLAEELIADKFGLAEVVESGGRREDPAFFGQRGMESPYPLNTIRGELVSHSGQRFNFITQLSPSIGWENPHTTSGSYSGTSSNLSQLLRYAEEVIRRQVSEFERRYGGFVDQIILEMNGYRQHIRTNRDLEELFSKAYSQDQYRMNYHKNYWETSTAGNWNYT